MSNNESIDIQALAEGIYAAQSEYVGPDHEGICINQILVPTLESFKEEISRSFEDEATLKQISDCWEQAYHDMCNIVDRLEGEYREVLEKQLKD